MGRAQGSVRSALAQRTDTGEPAPITCARTRRFFAQLSTANAEVETLRIDNISLQAQVDSSTAACTAAREQLRDRDVSLGRVRRDAVSATVPNSSAGAAVEQITQNAGWPITMSF
jgi:hypothetical protein